MKGTKNVLKLTCSTPLTKYLPIARIAPEIIKKKEEEEYNFLSAVEKNTFHSLKLFHWSS